MLNSSYATTNNAVVHGEARIIEPGGLQNMIQVHRENLITYLAMAHKKSQEVDVVFLGEGCESIRTAAIVQLRQAISDGEDIELV